MSLFDDVSVAVGRYAEEAEKSVAEVGGILKGSIIEQAAPAARLLGQAVDVASGAASELLGAVSSPVALGETLSGAVGSVVGAAGRAASTLLGSVGSPGTLAGAVAGAAGGVFSTLLAEGNSWGNLNPKLLANIYPCDADGVVIVSEASSVVRAPLTDATFEATLNWQSPFEATGPESKAPSLMAMLQTGHLATVIGALQAVNPIQSETINGVLNDSANKAKQLAKDLEGRTGITKLNSRQVFAGMPPIRIPATLHLRAMTDPEREVLEPYRNLLRWALPQELAEDGILTEVIASTGSPNSSIIRALFPSRAPMMVSMIYGGERYAPLVIESISRPLNVAMDRNGAPVYMAVQLVLATLTALDRNDVPLSALRIGNRATAG